MSEKVLKFRALSDENDNFMRDYDLTQSSTLLDLHNLICSDLGFDPAEVCSIFKADAMWERGEEFTSIDMGEATMRYMDAVTLGEVATKDFDRLIYLFDIIGCRALYMERVVTRDAKEGDKLPAVTLSEGDAPDQYEPGEGSGSASIFDDAFEEFDAFEGDENYDDE